MQKTMTRHKLTLRPVYFNSPVVRLKVKTASLSLQQSRTAHCDQFGSDAESLQVCERSQLEWGCHTWLSCCCYSLASHAIWWWIRVQVLSLWQIVPIDTRLLVQIMKTGLDKMMRWLGKKKIFSNLQIRQRRAVMHMTDCPACWCNSHAQA